MFRYIAKSHLGTVVFLYIAKMFMGTILVLYIAKLFVDTCCIFDTAHLLSLLQTYSSIRFFCLFVSKLRVGSVLFRYFANLSLGIVSLFYHCKATFGECPFYYTARWHCPVS